MKETGSTHTDAERASRRRVVAAVDGSTTSTAVVEAAYAEALRRGAVLEIVHVWNLPVYVTGFAPPVPMPPSVYGNAVAEAQAVLDYAVSLLPTDGQVAVVSTLAEGYPSKVLVDLTRSAELLVVGRRGHSRIAELLIGSTSRACVEHAHCPVLVVPPHKDDGARFASPAQAGTTVGATAGAANARAPEHVR